MKTQLSNLFLLPISKQMRDAGKQEKEILATMQPAEKKNFSAAELWNIQRRHRTISQRRRFA